MSERVTLVLDEGIGDIMSQLAGGERKRGQWLTELVRGMHENNKLAAANDFETFKLGFAGLVGQVKMLEGRLLRVENELSAMIANSGQ